MEGEKKEKKKNGIGSFEQCNVNAAFVSRVFQVGWLSDSGEKARRYNTPHLKKKNHFCQI